MPKRISTLQYVVQNFHTCGDLQLEAIRQEALKELDELKVAAAAHYQVERPIAIDKTVLSGATHERQRR